MAGDKLKLFISYSRRDMAAADALVTALEGEGFEITIDRRDLPYGEEWQKELGDFIRGSDTVVWLVSPDSVASKWCNWELGEVGRLHKRLVPVKIRDVAPEELPESLGRVHLLPVGGAYDPATHLSTLVTTLNTDRGWTKEATRLADRAREWIARERNDGLLLRGAGLKNAEAWSTIQPKAAPPPASEVLELILASRRAAVRRQRWTIGGALAVAAVALGLMALAIWQRGIAQTNEVRAVAGEKLAKANEEQAKKERDAALIAQSRFLVDQARQADANGDHGTALALALEALPDERRGRIRPYLPAAESMLYRAATTLRERRTWERIDTEDSAKFLPDGQRLITFSNRDSSLSHPRRRDRRRARRARRTYTRRRDRRVLAGRTADRYRFLRRHGTTLERRQRRTARHVQRPWGSRPLRRVLAGRPANRHGFIGRHCANMAYRQ